MTIGSSNFLKNWFGRGYKLKISLNNSEVNIDAIIKVIFEICGSSLIEDKIGRDLSI